MLEQYKKEMHKLEQTKSSRKFIHIGKKKATSLLKEFELIESEMSLLRQKLDSIVLIAKE